jgi:hypothetical protein
MVLFFFGGGGGFCHMQFLLFLFVYAKIYSDVELVTYKRMMFVVVCQGHEDGFSPAVIS